MSARALAALLAVALLGLTADADAQERGYLGLEPQLLQPLSEAGPASAGWLVVL